MLQLSPLHVVGGRPLAGEIDVQPSKNAALPIIVASLLSEEPITLHGIPRLSDIYTILEIMSHLGTRFAWVGPNSLVAHTPHLTSVETPYALVNKMRASFSLLGALLSRAGEAAISMPGGCTFSHRPVDQHIKALRALGADVREDGGVFYATRPSTLSGTYVFEMLTVGATQNAILAATLGEGSVILENCSIDTDVVDMVNFLNSLGADIRGAGTNTIAVNGVSKLRGGEYKVIPDRLEAGTLMMAAVATRGELTLRGVNTAHLRAVTAKLAEMNAHILEQGTTLHIDARHGELRPVNVTATEYPGFPTDLQPLMSALLATVPGTSIVTDRIYSRTSHVGELLRMGANVEVRDGVQVIQGTRLHGAPVQGSDLRCGAALVIAGLAAEGETIVDGMQHVNRGYERFAERLRAIGAGVYQPEPVLATAMD